MPVSNTTVEVTDPSGNNAAVKPASTAAVATDTSLVVALSPNSPVPAGSNAIGSVTVTGTTTVSGTVNQGTPNTTANSWPTEITDGTHGPAAVKAASTAAVAADPALVVAVSPNNSVAITAASLPLPTGAATSANQTTIGTQTTEINDGTRTATIKAASTAAVAADTSLVVALSPNSPIPTGANTIGVVNQGTGAGAAANAWFEKVTDGTNGPVAVKAASTAAVATDPSFVVALSPNSPIPTGANTIGALTANQSVNLAQVGGTNTVTGGVAGSQGVGGLAAAGAAVAGNPLQTGGVFNTSNALPTSGDIYPVQLDQGLNLLTFPGVQFATGAAWTSGTAINTLQFANGTTTIGQLTGIPAVLVQLDQTTTLTGGAVTFQGTYDGINWVTIPTAQVLNPNTLAALTNPYTFVASTQQPFLVVLQGYVAIRLNLTTVITGTGSVTPYWAKLPFSPSQPVSVGPVTVSQSDITGTGTLNAANATATITALAGSAGAGMQLLAGTLVGTIVPEISNDGGTTWVGTFFEDPTTGNKVASIVFGASNAATTRTIVTASGASSVRVRVSAFTSGTATCNLRASSQVEPTNLATAPAGGAAPPVAVAVQGITGGTSLPVTAAQGAPNSVANSWPTEITDGTHGPAAVKAASTAAVAADPALVVTIGPNTALPTGANVIGALTANQSVNLAQVGGTNTVTGGVAGSQGVGGLAASGAALAGNPVLVGGSDGVDARSLLTDASGRQIVIGAAAAGAAAAGNPVQVGSVFNTTAPAPANGQVEALQSDLAGNLLTFPGVQVSTGAAWTSATAINTLQYANGTTTVGQFAGAQAVLVQLDQTTTLTGGAVTFQGTYDGINWVTIPADQALNPQTYAVLTNPYTFVASTNQAFLVLLQGFVHIRLNLTTVITGTGSVTPYWAKFAASPVVGAQGTFQPVYGTNNQALTITMASLANAAARASTAVVNTANLYEDALIFVKVETAAAGTSATGYVNVFGYASVDGGTTYSESITGTDAAITLTVPTNLVLLAQINTVANATIYRAGPWSFCRQYGLDRLPDHWGIVIQNESGAALNATAANQAVTYQGVGGQLQ
jgi:hypothetical protein